jgi:hypothetical protein
VVGRASSRTARSTVRSEAQTTSGGVTGIHRVGQDPLVGSDDQDAKERQANLAELEEKAGTVRGDIDALEAQLVVDREVIAALQADGLIDAEKIANLVALISARQIGVATGILIASLKITAAAAFELLRTASQRTHRKLRDVAEDVILTGAIE